MAKKRIDSREKGKRREREFVRLLRSLGFEGQRTAQSRGSQESPDVTSEFRNIHWEIKGGETLHILAALEQAIRDAGSNTPIVSWRKNRGPWISFLRTEDLLNILERALLG